MKTILVVDDLPASRRLLVTFLGDEYRVIEAADGPQCLDIAARERPDLVLLDLSLPGLDGIKVIERIRSDPEIGNTPIFALTAHTLKEYQRKAVQAGCNEYLVKPFGLDELKDLVDRTLDTRAEDGDNENPHKQRG
ncbi:MAG: response regulator [Deltaproteobacteria bacterium]|nr:response regulator [Deltaproteobacteria bacterium]